MFVNIFEKDGKMFSENVHVFLNQAEDDALEWDGYRGVHYICTLCEKGKFVIDLNQIRESINDENRHKEYLRSSYLTGRTA